MTWSVPGQTSGRLRAGDDPLYIGSDWGIQVGSRRGPVRTLNEVATWSSSRPGVWTVAPGR